MISLSLSYNIYIHWLINRHKHFSATNESMRTFLAQQRRVSARRQSTAPWSKLDTSCSSTQNCRWTKCLHVFAAAWIFNFAMSQCHKAFIPPKRMEVPKLWHLHSSLCLRFCSASFWVVLFVFSRLTFSQSVPVVTLYNFVCHTQRAWTFASFSFLSKTRIGGLWRKNLHERLTLEFEARARFLKDVLGELRSVVLSRAILSILQPSPHSCLWRRSRGETMSLNWHELRPQMATQAVSCCHFQCPGMTGQAWPQRLGLLMLGGNPKDLQSALKKLQLQQTCGNHRSKQFLCCYGWTWYR